MVNLSIIEPIKQVLLKQKPEISLESIDKICDEFPCFHAAFVLKAILLKDENTKFDEALPQIAIRVLDRALLYDQIHVKYNESPKTQTLIETPLLEKAFVDEKVALTNNNELESIISSEKELEAIAGLAKELKKSRKKSISKEVLTKPSTSKKTKQQLEQLNPVKKNQAKPKSVSFIDWLKNKKSIEPHTKNEKDSERIPLDMAVSNEAALMMEVKKSALPLEDFIVNQIEKKQQKKEQGALESYFIVSETYAQILAKQGKVLEAIQVYKELSIKYPKKSSNFARQIENLKNSL